MTLKDDEQNRVPKFKIRAEHLDELKTIADAKGITVEEAIELSIRSMAQEESPIIELRQCDYL